MNIRPARPDEESALTALAIRSKAHWGYDEAFMEASRAALVVRHADTRPTFVAVDDGGTIVGFWQLIEWQEIEPDLEAFFVDPAFIGTGVGRALWEHLVSFAREHAIDAFTIASDRNAQGFYAKMGAERIGETPSDVFGAAHPLPHFLYRPR